MNSATSPVKVTIVVDVFRAFTTASYILQNEPASYKLTTTSAVVARLAKDILNPLLIGKPEAGVDLAYAIPNSPTRVLQQNVKDRHIIHRTAAGAKGVLLAKEADIVLVAGFVNAEATEKYVRGLKNASVKFMPMGHEGNTPSQEDDLCVSYIQALINGKKIELAPFVAQIKQGSGSYFFKQDQDQYPQEDFYLALETNRFNFAIQAVLHGDFATLQKIG